MNRFLLACALSATACGGAKTRDVLLSSEVRLEGTFTPTTAGVPLAAYTLDANGARVPVARFAFDQATNRFDVQVEAAQVQTRFVVTALDRVFAPNLAVEEDYANGRLDDAYAGIVSLEIGPPSGAVVVTGALGGYAKFDLPVKRASALTERVGAVLPYALESLPYAAARARVTTFDGVPIAGARVFSVESVVAANGASALSDPLAVGANRLVSSTTDAAGDAVVFPVPIDAPTRAFQLVADAPGYCTQTTNLQQMKSSIDPNFVYVLKLAACDRSTRLQAPDVLVEISPKNNTRDDLGQTVALVRAGVPLVVNLRLRNTVVGAIVANVYAGTTATGAPVSSVVYGSVEEEAAVKLPEVDGDYFVTFGPVTNPENAPVRGVRVSRSSAVPLALASDFTVVGPAGAPDVISGFAGKNFVVTYAGCTGVQSIGFFLSGQAITQPTLPFVFCDPAGNSFDPAELGLDGATGAQVMSFFVRDIFGNVSAVDTDGANQRVVFVDVSAPLLSDSAPAYTVDFGFAPAADAPGTNFAPYVFQRSAAELIRITPATIASFVLRFARPSACLSAPEPGAEVADERDLRIGFYQIVRSGVSSFATCGEDLPLAEGDLRFPTDPTAAANFLLTVKDLVGNTSEPSVYELPSCANPAASAACWEP